MLYQYHHNIDAVTQAQIVYHKKRARELSTESLRNIDRAWVRVKLSSKALMINDDGTFTLNQSPFMRRFLDGYYPLHVTIEIERPAFSTYLSQTTRRLQGTGATQSSIHRLLA